MSYKVGILEDASSFILSLTIKMQAKVQRTIKLLKQFGYQLPEPHSKKIKGEKKLFELRIKLGTNICRLFYFYYEDNIYIVTSGYVKKTNKTNTNEISKAKKLMVQFRDINNEKI